MPLDHIDLKDMKKSGDVEGLLCVLETGEAKEITEAVRILGELRHRKAVKHLIGLLEKDDIQVRANSAWALGEIGDGRAVLPLTGLLNDPSENVRIYAAWSLGRIGDKRAIRALKAAQKNGSSDMKKHAKEAIARIESNKSGMRRRAEYAVMEDAGEDDIVLSDNVDIPLVTLEVPDIVECEYISRMDGENGNVESSDDVAIKDTVDTDEENTRRIILGLKSNFRGQVSVDVLFRYRDGDKRTSSVWLRMNAEEKDGSVEEEGSEREPHESIEKPRRRASVQEIKKTRIKPARKHAQVEYEIPQYPGPQSEERYEPPPDEETSIVSSGEEKQQDQVEKTKVKSGIKPGPVEEPENDIVEKGHPSFDETAPEYYPEEKEVKKKEPLTARASPEKDDLKPDTNVQPVIKEAVKPEKEKPKQETKPSPPEPSPAKVVENASVPYSPPVQEMRHEAPQGQSVDSAVRLLSDIGMSGMTEAASAVTQLGGQEADSLQSRLRTLPTDQIRDELINLGEYIAAVEVKLHGKGESGEMKGEMQMYFPKNVALDIANELLCNQGDAIGKEFTDDIVSTLKETANIFGGQYVSAISEYIEIPIFLEAPAFKTGASSQIAEAVMKDITGKVEFALATDLAFGNGKTGRLIMLFDPRSYDIIITKLF